MTIPAQFDAKTIENKWYDYWMKNNYFHSEPDQRTPVEQYDSRCINKKSASEGIQRLLGSRHGSRIDSYRSQSSC